MGIETSCDETAISVVEDGRQALSNVIASQVEMHARYGGVVPEVASRQHVLEIVPTVEAGLGRADLTWSDIDAIAVTHGPGLAGALLVGRERRKGPGSRRGTAVDRRQSPGGPHIRQLAGGRRPRERTRLPSPVPHSLRRAHRPHTDGGPRALQSPGAHQGRRRRRGLRQGGAHTGPGLSRRPRRCSGPPRAPPAKRRSLAPG